MKRSCVLLSTILLSSICATSTYAAPYKWTDEKGVVHYSDQPPPENAKPGKENVGAGVNVANTDKALPYALKQAMQKYPVTLYAIANCGVCDQSRNFLKQRGIPFTEKNINTQLDLEAMNKIDASNNFPVIMIGARKFTGFTPSDLTSTLDAAGFPKTNQLPANYAFDVASPLAPVAENDSPANVNSKNQDAVKTNAPSAPKTTPGFRF